MSAMEAVDRRMKDEEIEESKWYMKSGKSGKMRECLRLVSQHCLPPVPVRDGKRRQSIFQCI